MKEKVGVSLIFNFIYEIVAVLTPLVITPYVSRKLGVDLIGVRSYTFSILVYFQLFANLGVAVYGQREIAKCSNDKVERSRVFFELFIIKSISSILVMLTYCVVFFGFDFLSEYKLCFLIWIIQLSETFFNITWYYQGIGKFKFICIRGVLVRILQIVLVFLLVKGQDDFYIYLILYATTPLLLAISLWPFIIKDVSFHEIKNINCKRHISSIFFFFIPTIATTIYSSLDKIMLGAIVGTVETGYYESAYKIILIATTIFTSIYTVMRSYVSNARENKNKDFDSKMDTFIRIMVGLVLPTVLGLVAVSDKFVLVFYGDEYYSVINLLKWFSIVLLFLGISGFYSAVYIVPYEKQILLSIVYIGATGINVLFNLLLIKRYYAMGALISTIIAEFIVVIGCIIISRGHIKIINILKKGWKYIIASLVMFATVYTVNHFLPVSILNLVVEIAIGIAVYALSLLIIREKLLIDFFRKFLKREYEEEDHI